jgi:hypothetical protein
MLKMITDTRRHPLVVTLLYSSAVLSSGAQHFHRTALGLGAWLERRRCERIARRERDAMRTREALRSGVPGSDMERVAFTSHPLFNPFRID